MSTIELDRETRMASVSPRHGHRRRIYARRAVARLLLRGLFRLLFRVRVTGLEHLPDTPTIVAANHMCWIDPFLLLLFLPMRPHLRVLGDREHTLKRAWRGHVIDLFEVFIPLDRTRPREAMHAMVDALAAGNTLGIFPEGQCGDSEGALLPLQSGAVRLSLQTGAPIVPCGIMGTSRLWLRRQLDLRVGPMLDPRDYAGGTPRENGERMSGALEEALRQLLPSDDDMHSTRLSNRLHLGKKLLTGLF